MEMMANFMRLIIPRTRFYVNAQNVRFFTRTAIKLDSSKISAGSHKVNNLEKKFLVWTGKFKNVNDVPTYVPGEMVEKARNKMRIRLANVMMVVTLLACLGVSISGKRAHERGESVQKQNLEWHKRVKEDDENNKQN